jgi:hypothetical protein
LKPAVPSHPLSATSSFSPLDLWAYRSFNRAAPPSGHRGAWTNLWDRPRKLAAD